jgi:HJR/Mrr/RecB family endonuclease
LLKRCGVRAESQHEMLAPDPRFEHIDAMEGLEFEAAVADLLRLLEFTDVQLTGRFDKGADIVAVRDGQRIAVQVKRWSTAVTIDAVRQLADGMHQYDCAGGLLVTNSFLTEPAIECAKGWGIEVWDRRRLADFLDGDPPEADTSVCAECGTHVSKGTTDWCLGHPSRYGGAVYCRKHQARSQRRVA